MIGRLKGLVVTVTEETALIDVNGVGYEIYASPRVLQNLAPGEEKVVSIETLVREDMIRLYGFPSENERQAFRLLQSVQGVGARHALAVLQVLAPSELYDAVTAEDVTAVARAHGVGKKLAQRIVTELQSKAGALAGATGEVYSLAARKKAAEAAPSDPVLAAKADAVSALANLGYDGVEARKAVARAAESMDSPGVEALIKAALKELAAA
ncbi:Holliday junction branch migration protein RuvA [Hyphococcus luteus]|uniref:Holliday junction branch migration complex subunit RuvA n=1 Tax=Hyphococcus luteus TaxID=2058213 RepID=A0A2S7K831_9PROT|nr:Holliday junction branch migration protein RuvA [Marinicaulis flavus]PQA88628.1 Holliday junction branch migration protein RuvA [Marinicaulis flavus]